MEPSCFFEITPLSGNETQLRIRSRPPTAAIVTTTPKELLRSIHTRMPAILQPDEEQLWLDPEVTAAEAVLPMLRPYPADQMEVWALEDTPDVREFERDPALAARVLRLANAVGT